MSKNGPSQSRLSLLNYAPALQHLNISRGRSNPGIFKASVCLLYSSRLFILRGFVYVLDRRNSSNLASIFYAAELLNGLNNFQVAVVTFNHQYACPHLLCKRVDRHHFPNTTQLHAHIKSFAQQVPYRCSACEAVRRWSSPLANSCSNRF